MMDRSESPVQAGIIVVVGGNEDKFFDLKILRRIVGLLEGDDMRIEVITTASIEPEVLGGYYLEAFNKIGVGAVKTMDIRQRPDASNPDFVRRIGEADIVFFTGGDQMRISARIGATAVGDAIRSHLAAGGVVAGTSAGAAALSDTMIYGGESTEALEKGVVQMTGGLSFIHNVVIDTHFIKRGRFPRLMQAVASNPKYIGLGLGEDSGLIIRDGHLLEGIGDGLVVIFDGEQISYCNLPEVENGDSIAVAGMTVHTMVRGSRYDLQTRTYYPNFEIEDE